MCEREPRVRLREAHSDFQKFRADTIISEQEIAGEMVSHLFRESTSRSSPRLFEFPGCERGSLSGGSIGD